MAALVDGGYDIFWLLELDLLSFNSLADVASRVRGRRLVEEALAMNIATQGGKKEFDSWAKKYLGSSSGSDDTDAFVDMVRKGGLR